MKKTLLPLVLIAAVSCSVSFYREGSLDGLIRKPYLAVTGYASNTTVLQASTNLPLGGNFFVSLNTNGGYSKPNADSLAVIVNGTTNGMPVPLTSAPLSNTYNAFNGTGTAYYVGWSASAVLTAGTNRIRILARDAWNYQAEFPFTVVVTN